jgi:hypothetical protein
MRPEQVFENIYNLMRFGSTISGISEVGGVATITTDNVYTLQDGMLVEINDKVYTISNLTTVQLGQYTFDVTNTSSTPLSASSWQLALYYEYGRALEINTTIKDKKQDPVNKNKRFPLVWLLTDIEKDTSFEFGYSADIVLAFVYLSEQNLKAKKRIETKMEPIIDPLIALFRNTMISSPGSRYFYYPLGEERLSSLETDKFKYGSVANNRHVFDDITDAIELNFNIRFSDNDSAACTN